MAYSYTDAVFNVQEFYIAGDEHDDEPLIFTATDKVILNALAHRADKETGKCFPGYGDIADSTLYSRSTVQRTVDRLKKFGFISVEINTGRGSNNYTLHMDKLIEAKDLPPVPLT